jgi:hypothetical protein
MADLGELDRSGSVKIAGSPSSGIEDNYLEVDINGYIGTRLYTASGSAINFGQATMAASLPVTFASDQSALKISNFPTTVDTNYGTVGASTLRTASQIGNATGGADFAAGNSSAQTLRVVVATNQSAIAVSQSGTWTVQPGNTANTTPWLVTVATALPTGANTIGAVTQASGPWTQNLTQVGGSAITLGQKTMANSVPVTISSDQSALAVSQSGTWTVQPGNTANTTPWLVTDSSDGPVAPGAVAAKSSLAGGQFNTALPTLTNTQQSAIQLDSSGRLIIAPLTSTSVTTAAEDHNYGTVGANTLRIAAQVGNATGSADFNFGTVGAQTLRAAAQIGNATGAADFAAGNSSAQTLRVVVATNQSAIAVSQSGTWTVQPGNTANTTPWLVTVSTALPTGANTIGAVTQASGPWTQNLTQVGGSAISLGQKTMANSVPVTLASDQSAVTVQDIINVSGQYRAQSVTTTAAEALGAATILANRKMLSITPTNGTVYWGYSNAVTTATGTPIFKNQNMVFSVGPSVHIYVISAGTVDCRMAEGS